MKILRLVKLIFLTVLFFTIFHILENGFNFDSLQKLSVPFLLSLFTMLMIFKPNFKRYALFLLGISLILMILADLFNLIIFSKSVGEFGLSLLVITIFLYLPQIIKKGHVEKF